MKDDRILIACDAQSADSSSRVVAGLSPPDQRASRDRRYNTSRRPGMVMLLVPCTAVFMLACPTAQESSIAAEAAKSPTPDSVTVDANISDSALVLAKSAFSKNNCGLCHSVDEYAAVQEPPGQLDLSTFDPVPSATWISKYLQRKETKNGRSHMKVFAGTDAELTALSGWLAAQQSDATAKKPSASSNR